ncbi:bifunctional hydroxymethylpyrimidine kinase/phosphomethylpyrimidine kinase [Crenobacter caeni]|uniref:hydroxymethylpyrimidine kinase n=1 Tax=Crenobacter caeni TaxID=2705474 RepID=A0A6B2KS37_9NEIS|nr:bifunctional hydroxymethylpyrimidine kinase/phosphomethylpyrimidine kinase [Crenobacter caeni]NDV13066.1 bifunctional hydroxymethylpyrimidine kinase/phosphomethylpyrimidine kinase [Crenobacter caeni]
MIPRVLTIAGSDSGGGAGIQADLKTFCALGAYGTSAITALTAQNTLGVQAVQAVDPAFVRAQCESVLSDIGADAVKCGMLANAGIVREVARVLDDYAPRHVVLDTVMIAKGGHPLLNVDAVAALRDELLPRASLITPNLPEAAALLGEVVAADEDAMLRQGERLLALGARAVLMKGGHLALSAESADWLVSAEGALRFAAPRIATRHGHGTGCSLSAALAALRPVSENWPVTVADAKAWLAGALAAADRLDVGKGIGPVHHLYRWW